MLVIALLLAGRVAAHAESAAKADPPTQTEWPPYVTVSRSVELPAMTESGQMRMAKMSQGTMVQLIRVDGDRVEVTYQGLTVRMPAAMTDLSTRVQARKSAPPVAPPPIEPPPAAAVPSPPAVAAPAAEPIQPSLDVKTFIETSMSAETFKASGLDKLSPAELQALDRWFLEIVLASKRGSALPQSSDPLLAVAGKKVGSVERALLVKNFNGEKVLVQRTNGEKWMLRAKTWCRWSWRYEGRYVCLIFGATTSQLINDYGETFEFWTDKQIE